MKHVGLKNRGNTCFMNTFLQMLMSIQEFNNYFISKNYIEDLCRQIKYTMNKQKKQIGVHMLLTRAFGNTLYEINQLKENENVYDPKMFHENFQKMHSRFQGFKQHDCLEALTIVLDGFHESLKYNMQISITGTPVSENDKLMLAAMKAQNEYSKNNYSIICELFNAQMLQSIICQEEGRENELLSQKFDPYTQTLLEIHNENKTLYDCLENFFAKESLDNDNLYYDEKSQKKVKSDIVRKYVELPPYLFISLKRFKQNMMGISYEKNVQPIAIPFEEDLLDLSDYTEGYDKKRAYYQLHAVGLHSGNVNFGHYYAYCKNSVDNKFYEYNDESVKEINLEEKMKELYVNGYIFLYKKCDNGI